MPNGVKKWFMLQIWRFQQVSQILTLVMLAVNLSLMLYDRMSWRAGLFESPYTAIPILLLALVASMWAFAIFWDLRMKMWREQATVLIDRNPYAKEKWIPKEIVLYELVWLPLFEKMGETDPRMKEGAKALREWIRKAEESEASISDDVKDLLDHVGKPEIRSPGNGKK